MRSEQEIRKEIKELKKKIESMRELLTIYVHAGDSRLRSLAAKIDALRIRKEALEWVLQKE